MSTIQGIKLTRIGSRPRMIILAVIVAILVYLVFSRPVLFRLSTGPLIGDPEFTIFNPIRDRSPERSAEAFLELMKAGQCEEAVATLSDDEGSRWAICEKEREYPLTFWRLSMREDESQKITLSFWYKRKEYEGEDRLFVWVEKRGDQWQVINYSRAY